MSFCTKCGRPRTGDTRFCTGCGNPFADAGNSATALAAEPIGGAAQSADPPGPFDATPLADLEEPAADTVWPAPGQDRQWAPPPDATRMDLAAGATRLDLPTAAGNPATGNPATAPAPAGMPEPGEPNPFASWYQSEPPAEATQTVVAAPGDSGTGYPPSQYGYQPAQQYGYVPPQQPPARPPEQEHRGRRRAIWIIVLVVIVLAAGGGAYALVKTLKKTPVAGPTSTPTAHAASHAPTTPPPSTTPASSPATSASTSSTPTATPTPTVSPSLVAIGPGVSSTALPQVEMVVSHYFDGINTHNYTEYSSVLTPAAQANEPESSFDSGYASSTDSGMTLTELTATGGGDLTATVTFQSTQSASDSVDGSTCNDWTFNFYLVPSGTTYLINTDPSGYTPSYTDC